MDIGFFKGKAYKLTEEVKYADGSVVSKIVLKNDAGSLTLFSFDKGQVLSEHTAPFDAVVQVIEGVAEVLVAGKSHLLMAGESIIMPANVAHAIKAVERFKMQLVMIKG